MLLKTLQTTNEYSGDLSIQVVNNLNYPISGANISISYIPGSSSSPDADTGIIETLTTDISGNSETIRLPAPNIDLSLDATNELRPYSEYNITVTAPGYESGTVSGTEILADTLALQTIRLTRTEANNPPNDVIIPEHTLYGEYPKKIPESEIKPISETGEIVLSRVVVPETIVVHDGVPSNSSAKNYYVPYADYIKNVASCEIYATWPESTITANVLAIMSFTMNRVFTEWYRNKGYDFTITSSTAYDQKWIYGRNIYENISDIVDDIFDSYLSRPNVKQPLLTQYCDGKRVTCPDWLSQWGSKTLGDRGYSPIEILRNYYGDDIYINTAEQISGIPASYPGYNLTIGSSGDKVRIAQEQLITISEVYSAIPTITADGIYGPKTAEAVRRFQSIFGLPQTGVIDYRTWYKISQIYVGITRIGEL